jgi:hypothetical protein
VSVIWARIGTLAMFCAVITVFTRWGFLTYGAHTRWERGMAVALYFTIAIFCYAVSDILKAIERRG